MSSFNDEEVVSPSIPSAINPTSSDYGISPMTTLSVSLGSNLRIRRTLSFHSNEVSPKKCDVADSGILVASNSPNRMAKFQKPEIGSNSPINSSRLLFGRRLSHNTIPANKENSSSLRSSCSMEYSLTVDDDVSPSKYAMSRNVIRERYPLEDQDPNSQDSGYSNSSSLYSEDSKSSSNFRFAEPNGVPPRRLNTVEFSPNRDVTASSMGKKSSSVSPGYRKQIVFHSMSTDSTSSDFSDDGFGENLVLPSSVGSLMMEQDENAQLPAGFSTLLSGQIFNTNKITSGESSPPQSGNSLLQTSLRRSLTENLTPSRTVIRSSVETEFSDLLVYEKEATKRNAQDDESNAPFLKRRKPNKLITPSDRTIIKQGPATAPPISIKGTLFSYGFKKTTNVKFQRSFSETEATITNALQRSNSDPNLIGDFTKPFVLPLKLNKDCKRTDLKNIDCHTLAKLINGEYDQMILSYSIIDCRYPYEFSAGHIKGAINLYTKEQIMEELNDKKYFQMKDVNSSDCENKRNILIFHCEFSSERGPTLLRYLRNEDRKKNRFQYPKLDYPEIYLLDGGYSKFYQHHKELCDPCRYVPMNHPEHSAELREFKAKSKSWACSTADIRKLRTGSLKRLGI